MGQYVEHDKRHKCKLAVHGFPDLWAPYMPLFVAAAVSQSGATAVGVGRARPVRRTSLLEKEYVSGVVCWG